jgi:hypothetical protein
MAALSAVEEFGNYREGFKLSGCEFLNKQQSLCLRNCYAASISFPLQPFASSGGKRLRANLIWKRDQ